MTIRMDEAEVIAALVGSGIAIVAAIVLFAWLVYLVVRPSRRRREDQRPEIDAAEAKEMLRLMARMEQRLEVLERVVAQDAKHEELLDAGEDPQMRRTQ